MANGTGTGICALCTYTLVLLYTVYRVRQPHSILNIYSYSHDENGRTNWKESDAAMQNTIITCMLACVMCMHWIRSIWLTRTSLPCTKQQKSFLDCIRLLCVALTITRIIIGRMKNMCSVSNSNICNPFAKSKVDKMRIFATQLMVRFDGIHMQIPVQLFYWPSAFVWRNSFIIKLNCHSVRRKMNKWQSLAETQHPG